MFGSVTPSSRAALAAFRRRHALRLPRLPPGVEGADDALRQQQRHQDEQRAQHEQPVRRQRARGEDGLGVVDDDGAERRADQRAAAADRDPDHRLDRIARREFAGVDDADLRHIERAGDAGHAGRQREHEQLVGFDAVAEKPGAGFGVAHRDQHLAELRGHHRAADQEGDDQRQAAQREQRRAGAFGLDVEAENILEIGQAVVAAEAEIVAEERQQQRIGHRLGDDREIDAGDAGAEREPAEAERQQARHQQHHQRREPEHVEAVPVPGQFRIVQEHHEIGQDRIAVDAAAADLAHQIHAHRVAAEREERAMAERENAAIAPDQVDRERQNRVADIFAEQRHQIGRHLQDSEPAGSSRFDSGISTPSAATTIRKTVALRSSERVSTCGIMLPPPAP